MVKPIELIPETITGEDRKTIKKEANSEYLKSVIKDLNLSVPMIIKNMLKYAEIDENYVENNLDYEDLRRELLMILNFDRVVPPNVTKTNVLSIIDEKHQGMYLLSIIFKLILKTFDRDQEYLLSQDRNL
jgi:hypothetical protein